MVDIGKDKIKAEKLLMEIKDQVSDKDSYNILARSFIKMQNDDEAIKQMYKALELDSSNPQTQLLYINIFLHRKDKRSNFLDSETVQDGYFVKIKKNGQEQEYLMTNDPQASIAKFELYKDSGLGKDVILQKDRGNPND